MAVSPEQRRSPITTTSPTSPTQQQRQPRRQQQPSSSSLPSFLGYPSKILQPILVILTCLKILLIPSYRSTDFDVHRNWLAVTKQLPFDEWYFNNVNGTTVHTLDYPPGFALFEYVLANNILTNWIFQDNDRCFQLLPDYDNTPSEKCIYYQRMTVIFSDIVLYVGAYFCSSNIRPNRSKQYIVVSFLLIILNPALLWIDHIHFQYNGMLLGILLLSLGCFFKGNNIANTIGSNSWSYDFYHLMGAILFATLLNLKHLYLPLAPLFFCYLLERYCLTTTTTTTIIVSSIDGQSQQKRQQIRIKKGFLFGKFIKLASVTATTLILPWIPFIMVDTDKSKLQLLQILSRLFPFGRGLLHDYWAANIWAIYAFVNRCLKFGVARLPSSLPGVTYIKDYELPEPSPFICAILLFLSIIPGMQVASSRLSNTKLMEAVIYVSFCAFMVSYHVHEKAIMTVIVPLTVLVEPTPKSNLYNLLFWHINVWGLLSIFPLLHRPTELLFKICSYVGYLGLASILLKTPPKWSQEIEYITFGVVAMIICLLEILPIVGKYEFLPLMITSIVCAFNLLGCWGMSLWLLARDEKKPIKGVSG